MATKLTTSKADFSCTLGVANKESYIVKVAIDMDGDNDFTDTSAGGAKAAQSIESVTGDITVSFQEANFGP